MENQKPQFVDLVGEKLSSDDDAHDLWVPIVQEYLGGGPDAAREYLEALGQQLEERVNRLLEQF